MIAVGANAFSLRSFTTSAKEAWRSRHGEEPQEGIANIGIFFNGSCDTLFTYCQPH
jgi:hypothetical protein